jgi:hypothetical protein
VCPPQLAVQYDNHMSYCEYVKTSWWCLERFDIFSFLVVTQCDGFHNAIEQGLSVVTPSAHAFMLHALMSSHTSVLTSSCLLIRLCGALALGVLLANVGDGKTCSELDTYPERLFFHGWCVPGGRLCLSFSALSVSLRTRV